MGQLRPPAYPGGGMTAGGKRPGAGRPAGTTTDDPKSEQVNVRLTPAQLIAAKRIGNGNASEGLRIALAAWPGGRNGMP